MFDQSSFQATGEIAYAAMTHETSLQQPTDINSIDINSNDAIDQFSPSPNQYLDLGGSDLRTFEEQKFYLFNQPNDFPHASSPPPSVATDNSYFNNTDPPFAVQNIYEHESGNAYPSFDQEVFKGIDSSETGVVTEVQRSNEQNDDQSQESREDDILCASIAFPTATSTTQNATTDASQTDQSNTIKSSSKNTINFDTNVYFCYLGPDIKFRLTAPPYQYQRARYAKELEKSPRYIWVTDQRSLTLQLSDHPDRFTHANEYSCYLQIIRTTIPIGNDKVMYIHPYPLWINDKNALVYNNTIFVRINTQTIKLDRLSMVRSKQNEVKNCRSFQIYSENEFNFSGTHEINLNERNALIDTYQLRYSILHFRVCMVNREGTIWLTDLYCQSNPIQEYEGPEITTLPLEVRNILKQSSKRKRVGESDALSGDRNTKKQSSKRKQAAENRPHFPAIADDLNYQLIA